MGRKHVHEASLSRRSLVKATLGAGALAASASMLAGCNGAATDPLAAPAADKYPIDAEEWGSGEPKHTEEVVGEERAGEGWTRVTNEGGVTLGVMDPAKLIQVGGFAFKDVNGNGKLDLFEDWRQPAAERARAMAAALPANEALAMMLHGSLYFLDADLTKTIPPSTAGWATDEDDPTNMEQVIDLGVRSVLRFASASDSREYVRWNNSLQSHAESTPLGVPVGVSNNPKTYGFPNNLGLAATFDPELIGRVGVEQAEVYRAEGVTTLLGPQIDLATEPRWYRVNGTYGEDPALARDLTNAFVSGLQSTYGAEGEDLGWGTSSVNGMMKHFPGDGPAESGRESHGFFGKYCVYPGNNFEAQLIPFVDGGLHLDSKTTEAAAVMDSYSIAYSDDEEYGELVGTAFSKWKNDLLREKCGYDGVICSDWGVLEDATETSSASAPWGLEDATREKRIEKIIDAGVDQIGGTFCWGPLKRAYDSMVEERGAESVDSRIRESARRVLASFYQVGLSDNPYLDAEASAQILADEERAALAAEVTGKSIVLLKNKGGLIKKSEGSKPKVYLPMKYNAAVYRPSGLVASASFSLPFDEKAASEVMEIVTDTVLDPSGEPDETGNPAYVPTDVVRATPEQLADCDFAVVVMSSPDGVSGYNAKTHSYEPISMTYGEYVADGPNVREESIAADVVDGEREVRSYLGSSSTAVNSSNLQVVKDTVALMGDKPVVVCMSAAGAMVFSEFEADVAAILMGFDAKGPEFLKFISGDSEPSGLLPLQMPKDMDTVEAQLEDVPRDMDCYVDSEGNEYDFGFGMNWSGVISDERTAKYCVEPLTKSEHIDL